MRQNICYRIMKMQNLTTIPLENAYAHAYFRFTNQMLFFKSVTVPGSRHAKLPTLHKFRLGK